jgi:hypothetical protein
VVSKKLICLNGTIDKESQYQEIGYVFVALLQLARAFLSAAYFSTFPIPDVDRRSAPFTRKRPTEHKIKSHQASLGWSKWGFLSNPPWCFIAAAHIIKMPVTRSLGRAQQDPPKTPPSKIMQTPKTPPDAPAKARPERHLESPLFRAMNTRRLPSSDPYVTSYVDISPGTSESSEGIPSATDSEIANFLAIHPFTASQIQMILWFSWTTTTTPTQIANMHNRAFSESAQTTSRWNVIDIENDVAINWHEHGRSFTGMEPMPLLVPPGDNNSWSCLCDFGVDNCWDYKRDEESGENLEKLSMARMLWDATPKELVRCPHGRRRQREGALPAAPAPRPSMLRRLGALVPVVQRRLWNFAEFWAIVDCGYSFFEMALKGWISVNTAQSLLGAWFVVATWFLTTGIGFNVAVLLRSLGWLSYGIMNPNVPLSVKTEKTVLMSLGYLIFLLSPGIRPGALTVMQVSLCTLWAFSAASTALEVDRDLGKFPEWVELAFIIWLLREVDWPMTLRSRCRWLWIQYQQRRFIG